jgi:hypothetical protein
LKCATTLHKLSQITLNVQEINKNISSQKKKFDAMSSIILTFIKRRKIKFGVENFNLLTLSLIVLEVAIIMFNNILAIEMTHQDFGACKFALRVVKSP